MAKGRAARDSDVKRDLAAAVSIDGGSPRRFHGGVSGFLYTLCFQLRRCAFALGCGLVLCLPSPAGSALASVPAPAAEASAAGEPACESLALICSNLELIDQLRRQGVEVDADGALARRLLADAARLSDGRVRSRAELQATLRPAMVSSVRREGWFTFAHVLWMVGAVAVVSALGILLRHYLARLIEDVPAWVWELSFYVVNLGGIVAGRLLPEGFHLAPVLPGCLGLIGALAYSRRRHGFRGEQWMPWVLALGWGATALGYGSATIGFLTVCAVLVGLGFAAGMVPGVVGVGFRSRAMVPRATLGAGVLLAVHVALHCAGASPAGLAPFRASMGFLGAFVFLLGLLVLANRYYWRRSWAGARSWLPYVVAQGVTCAAGVATIYLGTVHGVPHLLGLGGTFFCLFLLEKYYDLPWRGIGWAWSLLGAGGLLYLFAQFVQARPAWFFFTR